MIRENRTGSSPVGGTKMIEDIMTWFSRIFITIICILLIVGSILDVYMIIRYSDESSLVKTVRGVIISIYLAIGLIGFILTWASYHRK